MYTQFSRSGFAPLVLATATALTWPICRQTKAEESVRVAFVQIPQSANQSATPEIANTILAGRYRNGSHIAIAEMDDFAPTLRIIADDFVFAADPSFKHDGSRMAFAGKHSSEDSIQIWEIVGDSPAPERIVTCDADSISPIYMPNGRIVFTSTLSGEYEEHGGKYSFSLFEWSPRQRRPIRLTFNPSSDFDPVVLRDGRIAYSSWQHVGNHFWPRGNVALMLLNSDGTGIFPLTGNHRDPWLKRSATQIDGERIAFIISDGFGDFGAGEFVTTSLNDAFASYTSLISTDDYQVADAAALSDGRMVISARPTDGSRPTFGLYVADPDDLTLLYDDPDYHDLAPAIGTHRPRPELRVSTVVPDTAHGYLLVLNCNETDRTDQHPITSGAVKTVRVIEGIPTRYNGRPDDTFFSVPGREDEPMIRPNAATGYIPSRVLGEIQPAADGSVFMKVPADRPLRMQLIDEGGFSIISERAWFWVRPNERRVCIGCHENRELAPHNAAPLAATHEPSDLTDDTDWHTVTFRNDIQPILTANCALSGCHVPPTPTAAMNLTVNVLNGDNDAVLADRYGPAYANLLKRQEHKPFSVGGRRVHPGDSRQSPLLWMLYGEALGPDYKPAPFERPLVSYHPERGLSVDELRLIRKWIDLGAQYDVNLSAGPWPYDIPPAPEMEERDNRE